MLELLQVHLLHGDIAPRTLIATTPMKSAASCLNLQLPLQLSHRKLTSVPKEELIQQTILLQQLKLQHLLEMLSLLDLQLVALTGLDTPSLAQLLPQELLTCTLLPA